ncbi:hypothetical protein [Paeniglutamicibacter sp.]|uniref:hypothetical protein n=1 Tax=Paeniglutamicibacter sp. TaxID=1934391 RepID=UPI003988B7A4
MAINRAGFIARLFARLARPATPEPGPAGYAAPTAAPNPAPRETTEKPVPAPAEEPTPADARPAAATGDEPGKDAPAPDAQADEAAVFEATADEAAVFEATADEAAELPAPENDAPAEAAAGHPDSEALPDADADADADTDTTPEDGTPEDSASATSDAAAPTVGTVPTPRDHKVITLVSLEEHAGAKTLGAALERRTEGKGWRIRTAGPGLARAAFSGMLGDTDALVLVSPADPAITAAMGDKLRWLEANNRQGMQARTLIVVNLGTADGGELQLPADLDRPVTLLPFDAALSIPATGARAPRRAARAAIDQLVDELSTILQES